MTLSEEYDQYFSDLDLDELLDKYGFKPVANDFSKNAVADKDRLLYDPDNANQPIVSEEDTDNIQYKKDDLKAKQSVSRYARNELDDNTIEMPSADGSIEPAEGNGNFRKSNQSKF